jgi:hypothetical protein
MCEDERILVASVEVVRVSKAQRLQRHEIEGSGYLPGLAIHKVISNVSRHLAVIRTHLVVECVLTPPRSAVGAVAVMSVADSDWVFWAPKWQGRLKAFTLVACGLAIIGGVTADWEQAGGQHCFSGVKPGLKRMFNSAFGIQEARITGSVPVQRQAAEQ